MEQNQSTVNNNLKTKLPLISISELFKQSFSFYFSHFKLIFEISLLPFVLINLGFILLTKTPLGWLFILFGSILSIFSILALGLFISGKQQDVLNAYKEGVKLVFPFLWILILSGLALLGGFILLFIPAIILAIYFHLNFYVFVVENKRGLSVLAQSVYYIKGYWWSVLGRELLLGLLLGVLIFPLSFIFNLIIVFLKSPFVVLISIYFCLQFFTIPFTFIYYYLLYHSFKQIKLEQPSEDEERKIKRYIIFFCSLGIIGIIVLVMFLLLSKNIEAFNAISHLI